MAHDEYEIEVTAGRAEIASILEGVADGVRAGDVRLGDGADTVSVGMADELTLEIELEREDDEMALELEWPLSGEESPVSPIEESIESEDEEPIESESAEPLLAGATDGPQSMARFELF